MQWSINILHFRVSSTYLIVSLTWTLASSCNSARYVMRRKVFANWSSSLNQSHLSLNLNSRMTHTRFATPQCCIKYAMVKVPSVPNNNDIVHVLQLSDSAWIITHCVSSTYPPIPYNTLRAEHSILPYEPWWSSAADADIISTRWVWTWRYCSYRYAYEPIRQWSSTSSLIRFRSAPHSETPNSISLSLPVLRKYKIRK